MARRVNNEEIHIHIRGHATDVQPMLASEIEEFVGRLLDQSFQHVRAAGGGVPGHTRVRLALKLEPIEHVTDFSSHPMGEQLKEIARSYTRRPSLNRADKKTGWILEYLATQINAEDYLTTDESITRHLLTEQG